MTYPGGCHCGAVTLRYETAIPVEKWAPRACQCSFCRKHAARNVSDPAGHWHIQGPVARYRFALRTADFLLCTTCGCYLGCAIASDGNWFGSVNLLMLDVEVSAPDAPCDYDGEDAAQRISRRVTKWTPTTFS
jgi:hypothetical protein